MKKFKPIRHPKYPPKSRQNQPEERKGDDVPKRMNEFPKELPESTCIWLVEEKVEASLDLISVKEPLSVEVGLRSLHIIVLKTLSNENGWVLAIVLSSPLIVQSLLVQ